MYFGSIEIKLVILIALFFYGKGAFTHDMLTGRQFQLNVFLYSQSSRIFIRKGIINLIF